jgi:hypothetical protein
LQKITRRPREDALPATRTNPDISRRNSAAAAFPPKHGPVRLGFGNLSKKSLHTGFGVMPHPAREISGLDFAF